MRVHRFIIYFLWSILIPENVVSQAVIRCNSFAGVPVSTNTQNQVNKRSQEKKFQLVFHILYTKDEENISDAQIYSQVEMLNKFFQSDVSLYPTLPKEFIKRVGVPQYKFCLATIDPMGNNTTGITRTFTSISGIACKVSAAGRSIMHEVDGGKEIWNPKRYINIYIANTSDCNFLAEGIFPWDATLEEDGVIIDYRAVGIFGRSGIPYPFNQGKTLVHELGHFFGLYHLSADDEMCNGDDLVDDTPIQSGEYYACPDYPQFSCGSSSMYMNFMSLVYDPCMYLFSKGQVERMNSIINQYRAELESECFPIIQDSSEWIIKTDHHTWQICKKNKSKWNAELSLFDIQGRLLWKQNNIDQITVTIPLFHIDGPPAVYILQIKSLQKEEIIKLYKL